MQKKLIQFYLTAFGAGYSPIAPGTMGSLLAVLFIYVFRTQSLLFHIISFISFTFLSYFLLNYASKSKMYKLDDPSWVVQDEVSGLYLTFLIFTFFKPDISLNLKSLSIIFLAFRIFDIIKPWPISYFDKKHTPSSIMHDDLFAALYAALVSLALTSI